MQSEVDHHHHSRRREPFQQQQQQHLTPGAHKVPLLAHAHPPLNFARHHHQHIPLHDDPGYGHYRALRDVALANGVKNHEVFSRSPVGCIAIENERLTVHYHSQSKLSQQELADLQKATHFDKKELQQWYKGMGRQPFSDKHRLTHAQAF